jgi:uncharacterized protein (DUF1697 family)
MKTYNIFLRGINVNGIKIKMADLKQSFENAGYQNVITILATGNVIVSTDKKVTSEQLKREVELQLRNDFGYEAFVVIKEPNDISNILKEATPLLKEGFNAYLILSNDNHLAGELKVLFDEVETLSEEQLVIGEFGIYWVVEKGYTLESNFGKKVLGLKKYKEVLTSRTLNTIIKVNKKNS